MLPPSKFTMSQIDRLGDRLRKGGMSAADLGLLNDYKRTFTRSYEAVVGKIQDELELEPTGRFPKTSTSIIDKLQREHVRLSQMQDIAGCRLIVEDMASQDEVITRLKGLFDKFTIDDRRERPSHGYRAVHVIVDSVGKFVEIQVRTRLQQGWAEFSEKLSDVVDRAIKYGGGNEELVSLLAITSDATMNVEMAIKSKDIDRMQMTLQQALESFERLSEVIRRVKGTGR